MCAFEVICVMLIPPFLVLEPVKMVHHLSKGRSMFGLVRARVSYQC